MARRAPDPATEPGPSRTVEIALSADLAGAVGDADVFIRALNALSTIAPRDLAVDILAVAELASRDLRLAQQRWATVRARLDGEMVIRGRPGVLLGNAR